MRNKKYKKPQKGYKDLSPFFKKFFARFGFLFKFFARFGFLFIEGRGKPYYVGTQQGKIFRVTAANKLKEMKDGATPTRYGKVDLKQADGTFKTEKTHRIIGEFIDNPDNKPLIHHSKNRKNENCIDDLKWATYKENAQYYQDSKKERKD